MPFCSMRTWSYGIVSGVLGKLSVFRKVFVAYLQSFWDISDLFLLKAVLRIRDVYPGSNSFLFRIPDLGSRVDKIPDPHPHQRILVFLSLNTETKFSNVRSGMFIPDPGFWLWIFYHSGSRIQRSKRHRIPDQDPQHCEKDRFTIPTSSFKNSIKFRLRIETFLQFNSRRRKYLECVFAGGDEAIRRGAGQAVLLTS